MHLVLFLVLGDELLGQHLQKFLVEFPNGAHELALLVDLFLPTGNGPPIYLALDYFPEVLHRLIEGSLKCGV